MFEKYRKEIIILGIVIIIPIIFIGLYYMFRNPVETKDEKNGSKLPYINISGKDTDAINKYLEDLYKNYSNDKKSKLTYKTEKYKNIISLLVSIDEFNNETNETIRKYLGFNVKEDGTFIDKEEMAELFGYSLEEIVDKVDKKLNEYYQDEAIEGYIDSNECSYNCYLSYARGINNILNEISLVIENGKLTVYINLSKDDINGDKEYFEKLENPDKIILE